MNEKASDARAGQPAAPTAGLTSERLAEIRDIYVEGLVISSASAVAVVQELLAALDAVAAELEGTRQENFGLAADLATADATVEALAGVLWMAQEYAQGSGSRGPEMRDFEEAQGALDDYRQAMKARPTTTRGAAFLTAAGAFVEHHDAGQAPKQPKTLAEDDAWHAEWDRRLDALRALVGRPAAEGEAG